MHPASGLFFLMSLKVISSWTPSLYSQNSSCWVPLFVDELEEKSQDGLDDSSHRVAQVGMAGTNPQERLKDAVAKECLVRIESVNLYP